MIIVLHIEHFKILFNGFSVYFGFLGQFCKIASDSFTLFPSFY